MIYKNYVDPVDVILLSYSLPVIYTLEALCQYNYIHQDNNPYKEYIILMPNSTQAMHKIIMDRIKSRNPCNEVIESMNGKLNAIKYTNRELKKINSHVMEVGATPARLNPSGFNYIEYAIDKVYGHHI